MTLNNNENEIVKSTTALMTGLYVNWYAELLKIKYSKNPENEIDNAISMKEEMLNLLEFDYNKINESMKKLFDV